MAWNALYLAGVSIPNAGWGRPYQNTPPNEQYKSYAMLCLNFLKIYLFCCCSNKFHNNFKPSICGNSGSTLSVQRKENFND